MSTQNKFNQLTAEQKKQVSRQVSEVKQFGKQVFWLETGSQVDEADFWQIVKFVMGW